MALSTDDLQEFLEREFPQIAMRVEAAGQRRARVRQEVGFANLRPGGTISGPTMMALADTATYVVILAEIGLIALAVTTNLNISFMRKPEAGRDLIANAELLKLGSRLAVADVRIHSDGVEDPVAHAQVTYSIPPRR